MVKATKKPAAKKSAKVASPFKVGQSVKVLQGDWGNARGEVCAIDADGVHVELATARHRGPLPFEADNLVAL